MAKINLIIKFIKFIEITIQTKLTFQVITPLSVVILMK